MVGDALQWKWNQGGKEHSSEPDWKYLDGHHPQEHVVFWTPDWKYLDGHHPQEHVVREHHEGAGGLRAGVLLVVWVHFEYQEMRNLNVRSTRPVHEVVAQNQTSAVNLGRSIRWQVWPEDVKYFSYTEMRSTIFRKLWCFFWVKSAHFYVSDHSKTTLFHASTSYKPSRALRMKLDKIYRRHTVKDYQRFSILMKEKTSWTNGSSSMISLVFFN